MASRCRWLSRIFADRSTLSERAGLVFCPDWAKEALARFIGGLLSCGRRGQMTADDAYQALQGPTPLFGRQRRNKAFLSDTSPVPFVVNNDGTLSRNAAEVFFAALQAAETDGRLDDEIIVLELGIGVGLFARYFLDSMRELCRRAKKDYYDR